MFRLTPSDTSLGALASTIEGMERRALAREWSYRRRERYQAPLALGVFCLAAALLLPLPRFRRPPAAATQKAATLLIAFALTAAPGSAASARGQAAPVDPHGQPQIEPADELDEAEKGGALDEVLLRPRRLTERGRRRNWRRLVQLLGTRLRVQAAFARHP